MKDAQQRVVASGIRLGEQGHDILGACIVDGHIKCLVCNVEHQVVGICRFQIRVSCLICIFVYIYGGAGELLVCRTLDVLAIGQAQVPLGSSVSSMSPSIFRSMPSFPIFPL